MSKVSKLLAGMNKKYNNELVNIASDTKEVQLGRITSGSLYLDRLLGKNKEDAGWPRGRIVELFGPESSGKTTLMLKTIAEAQKNGLTCAFFDVEKGFEAEHAKDIGVDLDKLIFSKETMGEVIIEMICDFLQSKEVDLIVVDSVASMIAKAEKEVPMYDSNRMALPAAMLSTGLRKLTTYLHRDCTVVFINQLRESPGVKWGNPEYTPGGRALKFYASVRVELRSSAKDRIKKGKKTIGQIVNFKIVKNKVGSPVFEQDNNFKMYYDGTFDPYDELINMGELAEVIYKKGAYFYIKDYDDGFHGREDLEKELKNNSELFENLKKQIYV